MKKNIIEITPGFPHENPLYISYVPRLMKGELPNSKTIELEEHLVAGDGDCGLYYSRG